MCDPITLIAGALGAAGSLFSKTPKPPKVETPAAPAPSSKTPNATVRVGADDDKTDSTATADYLGFTEERKAGKAIGGLGRGGLTI